MAGSQQGQSTLSDWGSGTEVDDDIPPWQSPVVLQQLCYEEELGPKAIAEKLGCTEGAVFYWTDKYGIERPERTYDPASNPASYSITDRGYAQWQAMTPDGVRSIYVHQLITIAEHGIDAVKDRVVHHKNEIPWDNRPENLTLMTDSEHGKLHANDAKDVGDAPWRDEETLREMYVEDEMSMSDIGDELGCSTPTVLRWMEKYGIERRNSHMSGDSE